MNRTKKLAMALAIIAAGWAGGPYFTPAAADARPAPAQQAAAPAAAKPIGTVKAIAGNTITLASDSGAVFSVAVEDSTRFLRIEPGAKDLKNADPLQLADVREGDRILVMGAVSADGHSVAASSVIVMKKADVETKQQRDLQDWQRRGVGGLVSAVDPAAGNITISTSAAGGPKTLAIQVSKSTILRRYAPDSVKFDDARPATLGQINVGDQVRARGTRSADGAQLAADEIVAGSFRNISGTISSIDPASNTFTVADLATKKPVDVRITPESQIRKLPPQMAQVMAVRLKGGQGSQQGGASTPPSDATPANRPDGARAAGGRGGGQGGDLQQMLSRVPPAKVSDFQKGNAVMIVSTEGTASGTVTAITIVGGVEPILEASPNGSGQGMILPPWSLDAPTGDAEPQ